MRNVNIQLISQNDKTKLTKFLNIKILELDLNPMVIYNHYLSLDITELLLLMNY